MFVAPACEAEAPDPGWMAAQPDDRTLAELSIPGTHDSGALHDILGSGTARTQELAIATQLDVGVRYLDIRCRHVADAFEIYHGPIDQQQTFDEVLATTTAFLDSDPMQTVIMSIKEEFNADRATRPFAATFEAYVALDPARWYLGPAVPVLGDVRGKIVLLRRFASTTTPLGLDGDAMWADDTTFTIQTADARLRVQDNYRVENSDVKWASVTAMFDEASTGEPTTWYINHTSGFQMQGLLPNTPVVAMNINERLNTYFADSAMVGHLGTVVMDFASANRTRAIIDRNAAP